MVTINECTVRYMVGPVKFIQDKQFYWIREVLHHLSDIIPDYVFHSDDEYVWVYFICPPNERCKRILEGWTGNYEIFYREERLD